MPIPLRRTMIKLTKLNDENFVLNANLIKFVEEKPDTIITLQRGEKILVKNSADDVIEKVIEYARAIRPLPEQLEHIV